MRILELYNINKTYFDHREIARVLGIKPESARVLANRYVHKNILIRAKRDMYILRDKWLQFNREQRFEIASLLQVPSYISLTTALEYYEITTQMQRDFIESICLKRTKELAVDGILFTYTRLNAQLYTDFIKVGNFFIATAEKAFLDALYLMSLGRYRFDLSAIDIFKLDMDLLGRKIKNFPVQTQNMLRKYGYISST